MAPFRLRKRLLQYATESEGVAGGLLDSSKILRRLKKFFSIAFGLVRQLEYTKGKGQVEKKRSLSDKGKGSGNMGFSKGDKDKGKSAAKAVEVESEDLGIDLSDLDFGQVGDPDAGPDLPAADSSEPPWEESGPDVPGEDDLDLGDLGLPSTDDASILAEYIPPLRQAVETLVGQVGDFHDFAKKRAESQQAAFKAVADSLSGKLDDLESKVHDLTVLIRQLVQGTAPKEMAAEEKATPTPANGTPKVTKPAGKEKPPPVATRPSLAEAQEKFKLKPPVDKALTVLNGMAAGKELTLDQFKNWLQTKVGWTEKQGQAVIDYLKVKGPVNNKTFA